MTTNTGHLIATLDRYATLLAKKGDRFGGHIEIGRAVNRWNVTVYSDYEIADADKHITEGREFWTIEARDADLDTALEAVATRAATAAAVNAALIVALANLTTAKVPA